MSGTNLARFFWPGSFLVNLFLRLWTLQEFGYGKLATSQHPNVPTRSRTWVVAATTRRPNYKTIRTLHPVADFVHFFFWTRALTAFQIEFESTKLTVPEAWTLAHGMSGRSPDTQRYLRDELRNLAKHVNEEKQQETSQPRVDKLLLTVFGLRVR